MHTDYTYSEDSRRPITVFALAVSVATVMLGFAYGAPWYFLAPVGLAAVMSAAMVLRNRKSGLSLSGSTFHMYVGQWAEHFAVSDIKEMRATRWSDGAHTVNLLLTSGKEISIPGYCVGSVQELEAALAARSINTRWNP